MTLSASCEKKASSPSDNRRQNVAKARNAGESRPGNGHFQAESECSVAVAKKMRRRGISPDSLKPLEIIERHVRGWPHEAVAALLSSRRTPPIGKYRSW